MKRGNSDAELRKQLQAGGEQAKAARSHLLEVHREESLDYLGKRLPGKEAEEIFNHAFGIMVENLSGTKFTSIVSIKKHLKGLLESQRMIGMIRLGPETRKKAMREIVTHYHPKILSYLKARTDAEQAQDLAGQSVLNLVENVLDGKFKGRCSVETYLWSIVRNLLKRVYGGKSVENEHKEIPVNETDESDPEILFMGKEVQLIMRAALAKLKEKCREILRMWMMRYRMAEIAETLGYQNEAVVRNTKRRCFLSLVETIKNDPNLSRQLMELQ